MFNDLILKACEYLSMGDREQTAFAPLVVRGRVPCDRLSAPYDKANSENKEA